ncbi:MAG: CHAT domain-containing protein [Planctomycetota bacterium]|nr:MAG: CHAT domain-containing protein [Planctomycetota bacterium]REK44751.1 MAG: CHAT domain-containing protein [Planctomycetota bacterium]
MNTATQVASTGAARGIGAGCDGNQVDSSRPAVGAARVWLRAMLAVLFCMVCCIEPVRAQGLRGQSDIIKPGYFATFPSLLRGDYRTAERGFEQSLSRGIKTTESRWIDSICYYAMAGEVAYRTGANVEALKHFNAAIRLYERFYNWMLFVEFTPLQADVGVLQTPPWGQSKRAFRLANYPGRFGIERTQLGVAAVDGQAAVTQQTTLWPLHVDELVRCTVLAIRRRHELLGPVSSKDKLTSLVLARTTERAGPVNHWSSAWIDLQQGLAMVAAGRARNGRSFIQRSLVAGGQFDHPLTCVGLLELGKLAFADGNYEGAGELFLEASYSAFYFDNPMIIEEALRHGYLTHVLANKAGPYRPLEQALSWARMKRYRVLEATLAVLAAEHALLTGQRDRVVQKTLARAAKAARRNRIELSRVGAHYNYVKAVFDRSRGNEEDARAALNAAMEFMRRGSKRVLQTAIAHDFHLNQKVRPREALDLYARVLRDPPAVLWRHEPLEAQAMLTFRNYEALGSWYDLAIQLGQDRDDMTRAIEIADQVRRWRFHDTLPERGRQLGLRWVLAAREADLTQAALLQRADLLERYPRLRELGQEAAELARDVEKLPIAPREPTEQLRQRDLLEKMAANGRAQDAVMHDVTLRREPIEMIFPPPLVLDTIREQLGERQAILMFFERDRQWHGFLIMKKQHRHWRLGSVRAMRKALLGLHRSLGNVSPNVQFELDHLEDIDWLEDAEKLTEALMKDSRVSLDQNIDELIVVPDGLLWYAPFELLQVGPQNRRASLSTVVRLRYAPTVALAVGSSRPLRRDRRSAVVLGRILPADDELVVERAADRLLELLPRAEKISERPESPASMLAKTIDALVVLDAVEASDDPYRIVPWQIDEGRAGSRLAEWMSAPLGAPELVVWPGFRTPAENGLKNKLRTRAGDDLFMSICGMMSAGTRSLLISRWRTGGQLAQDLMREYLQELPHLSASDAWQRSVEIARAMPLDPRREPRLRGDRAEDQVTGRHPYFWSGYLLIDNIVPEPPEADGNGRAGAADDEAEDDLDGGPDREELDEERRGFPPLEDS